MDKNTLSSYGWIVVLILILSVLLAFMTPLGSFIAGGFKSITGGFIDTNNVAMEQVDPNTGKIPADQCSHENTELQNQKSASCKANGYTGDEVCKDCNTTIKTGTVVNKTAHTAVTDPAVAATCEQKGKTEGSHCSVCKTQLVAQRETDALGHDWGDPYVAEQATCLGNGISRIACKRAGCDAHTDTTIVAEGHKPTAVKGYAATCTKTGLTDGEKCSKCGAEIKAQTTIKALGHTTVTDSAISATCEVAGKTEGSHCSTCSATIKAQTTIPALGHAMSDPIITTMPTCTADGYQKIECTRNGCDYEKRSTINKTGHTTVVDNAVSATCTIAGKTEGSHCSVCKAVIKAQETVPALGHNMGTPVTTLTATCTSEGQTKTSCKRTGCGYYKVDSIPAKGHTEVTDNAVSATCTATGLTAGSHCSVCNTALTAQTVTPALGHSYGTPTYTWTGTTACKASRTCSRCSNVETATATITNAITTAAKCTTAGVRTYTAKFSNTAFATQTKTESIAATGHTEVTDKAIPATCLNTGKTEGKHCSVCGTVTKAQTTVAALGHDIIKDNAVAATCTKTGLTEGEHCSRCDYKITQTTTDALGHDYNSTTKEATCTEGGSTITTCSRCGDSSTTTTVALGHNYIAEITTKATCTTTGVRTYTCSRCGNSYTESIAATGHLHTEIRNADTSTGYTGDTYCKDCGKIISYGKYIIPEGGTYTTADGTVYEEGDAFPSTVTDGDTYSYGEYEYKYNYRLYSSPGIGRWEANISQNGWGVRYLYDRANPAQMLESINGKPITSMRNTFYQCRSVVVAPAIPSTVTDMYYAFANCYKLTTVGKLPLGLKNLIYAFSGCQVLTKAPAIPSTVTEMSSCFSGCKALTDISAVKIPSAVTNLDNIFSGCKSLVDASNIVIGSNVVFLDCGFVNCTSLKKAPNVSNTTASMLNTFLNCTSLTGTVKFNGNPRRNNSIFEGVDFEAQNLTLAGSASALDTLGSTGNNYCSECNGKCSNITEHHVCTISGGICTICGETATVIESTHNSYANNQDYVVLGTWNYTGAKSVNIKIVYQTESTSYDWCSITSGTNYSAGSSYSTTRSYLNTSGSIVSATGTTSSVKFGGKTKTITTFDNVNMLTGSVIFRTDSSGNSCYGVSVIITPNY